MEEYIDVMLVKSKSREDHMAHLQEAFQLIRLHCLWLNPDKCTFGVGSGNFLRFLVIQMGIEMASGQVKAIEKMQPPINKKQVHALIGTLATLNRFISRYSYPL